MGPSVTFTAFATASMPASSDLRLASPNCTSVAIIVAPLLRRCAAAPGTTYAAAAPVVRLAHARMRHNVCDDVTAMTHFISGDESSGQVKSSQVK